MQDNYYCSRPLNLRPSPLNTKETMASGADVLKVSTDYNQVDVPPVRAQSAADFPSLI